MNRLKKLSMLLVAMVLSLAFLQFKKIEKVQPVSADPEKIYTEKCASCHGEKVEAFVDKKT
jgi:cytochrome c